MYKLKKQIQNGTAKRISQNSIDPIGLYCGVRTQGDEIINWNQTSREIFNFVRAICKPGPMARSFIRDKEIKINKVRLIQGIKSYINIPGQIIGKTDIGFYVKTKDTFVEVVDYEYEGQINIGNKLGKGRNE